MPRTIFESIVIQHFKKVVFFELCEYTSIRFFEIIHFQEGTGIIKINGNTFLYEPNSFYIFLPDDKYTIQVDKPTTASTIKFSKSLFNQPITNNTSLINDWFKKIEISLTHVNINREVQFQSILDKKQLIMLIEILSIEKATNGANDVIIFQNTLSTILHIIARNFSQIATRSSYNLQNSNIQDIINFIHLHIYEPELLTNNALAEKFNIADSYIGQFFKKQMGISLKKYILNYKLKLVETRLKYTDLHFSEIAHELGFTDASHLNKTFIAYKGMTIGAFREGL